MILGKDSLNQTYFPAQIPLLHSAFLTLISLKAINEIYHRHQPGRGREKKWQAKTGGDEQSGGQVTMSRGHNRQLSTHKRIQTLNLSIKEVHHPPVF